MPPCTSRRRVPPLHAACLVIIMLDPLRASAPAAAPQKRKEFEDNVRRVGRWNPTIWVKYATWEEQQKDFRRARSVWERALETDYR